MHGKSKSSVASVTYCGNHGADSKKNYSFKPKTLLGKNLLKIRRKIVESGEPLLGWDDIEREKLERRGEIE